MRKTDNLPPSCTVVTKSGNLHFVEPSGPLRACNGTDLPLPLLRFFNYNFVLLFNLPQACHVPSLILFDCVKSSDCEIKNSASQSLIMLSLILAVKKIRLLMFAFESHSCLEYFAAG